MWADYFNVPLVLWGVITLPLIWEEFKKASTIIFWHIIAHLNPSRGSGETRIYLPHASAPEQLPARS